MQIEGRGVGVDISGRQVVSGVDLTLQPGTMIAITGHSGSGKTTLLNCLGLLIPPSRGDVLCDGERTTRWGDSRRVRFWRDHAAFIYQDHGILDDETVVFNVALRKRLTRAESARARAVLEGVGLSGREHESAAVLSGGEKQRVGVARAMYKEADVVFADEPTASLDHANRENVTTLLRQCAERGACVTIATHDLQLARVCDAVIELPDPQDAAEHDADRVSSDA